MMRKQAPLRELSQQVRMDNWRGSGIGAALAHAYWRKGAKVAISGRRLEKLHATIANYSIAPDQALAIECDA